MNQCYGGNYNGTPNHTISILDGIKSKINGDQLFYDKGCDLVEDKVTQSYISQCEFDGKPGFKASYWNNSDREGDIVVATQITNPIKLTTAGQHEFASGVKLEGFSALYETEFVAKKTEELVLKGGAAGDFEVLVNGDTIQKYINWRLLSSRMPIKVEAGKKYKIEIRYAQENDWQANIELNFGKEVDVDYTSLIKKLEGYDVVVFVGGLSGELEGEEMPVSYPGFKGGDRTNIDLPAVQRNCLKALKEAGEKVVFVNCSGSAIALTPETQTCEAILQAWYAGEQGGLAIADVLFGDYNPAGKLPISFYKNSDILGDFEDYSMKGRTYRYTTDVLFPFGYGLSYTNFEIGKARLSKTAINAGEGTQISVPVSNAGAMDGTEIIQVYVRKVNDIDGPLKTLKGFKRVAVKAGKTEKAVIELAPEAFEFYDWEQRKMAVTPGEYEVSYGNSSDDKDLKTVTITIK